MQKRVRSLRFATFCRSCHEAARAFLATLLTMIWHDRSPQGSEAYSSLLVMKTQSHAKGAHPDLEPLTSRVLARNVDRILGNVLQEYKYSEESDSS